MRVVRYNRNRRNRPNLATTGRIRQRVGRRSVGLTGRRIRSREYPAGCLAVPDERVSHDIHVVAQAKIHIGVGRAEIIAVRARSRMDECPLQIVLRGNLVELFLDECNVFFRPVPEFG